jgi:hypothetical protein
MKILTQYLGASTTLLDYSLATSPTPLQVSPASGPPSVALLSFVISCPVAVGEVKVQQIAFNLPVGDPTAPQSTDLTETATGITASVSSSGADQWQIAPGVSAGSFVLTPAPQASGLIDGQGLTVTLSGIEIGPVVGTALLEIVELASSSSSPAGARLCAIQVAKFPYGFFAGNFAASEPMIDNGGTVTLSWIGSTGPRYRLLWASQSLDVSTLRRWTSPALTDSTTFILQVSAQQGGQTVDIHFSLTVIVARPNIVATQLQVLQSSALNGPVAVGSSSAPANLVVAGNATAAQLSASQGCSADNGAFGALAVSGAATLNTLTAQTAQAASLTVPGLATLNEIRLGAWSISVDGSGNLNFSNGKAQLQIGASTGLVLNGLQVIADSSPVTLFSPTRNGYLNGSNHFGGNCRGFEAAAYWMVAGYPPDGDSNLVIKFGNPFS